MKKKTKNTKPVNKLKSKGPGRPAYVPVFPAQAKWTFDDLLAANNENGKKVTPLTLRKFLKADMYNKAGNARPNSTVALVKGELVEPKNKDGLGRKRLLYTLRNKSAVKTVKISKSADDTNVSVNVGTSTIETPVIEKSAISPETQAYEAKKAELTAPVTPVVITPEEVQTSPVAIKTEVVSVTPAETPVLPPVVEPVIA